LYEKRRPLIKEIPGFWPRVLNSSRTMLAPLLVHDEDQEALKFLEDVWIIRDEVEPRVFTLELVRQMVCMLDLTEGIHVQHFKENPFFSNSVLKKVYKYSPPADKTANSQADANGISDAAVDFEWETDVTTEVRLRWTCCPSLANQFEQPFEISWKDDAHNLTKKYPQVVEGEDDLEEYGSFFNFFGAAKDYADVSRFLTMSAPTNFALGWRHYRLGDLPRRHRTVLQPGR
jgi:template-activating factor I